MQKLIKSLITVIGVALLGIGMANAAPSTDCGDDDVQPINVHSAAQIINKES